MAALSAIATLVIGFGLTLLSASRFTHASAATYERYAQILGDSHPEYAQRVRSYQPPRILEFVTRRSIFYTALSIGAAMLGAATLSLAPYFMLALPLALLLAAGELTAGAQTEAHHLREEGFELGEFMEVEWRVRSWLIAEWIAYMLTVFAGVWLVKDLLGG